MVNSINGSHFDEEVLQSDQVVLVDFWASWCGPCRMFAPIVEEFAQENPQIKVCKVNVDEESELAARYQVMSIPTLVSFQGGSVLKKSVGVISKEEIQALVTSE